jgi:hypothetical protein
MSEGFRLGVVYESGLLGSSHGGMGRAYGVTLDCPFSKWVCSMSKMVWGCKVICPVLGSVIMDRFGWSLAHGCNPATVFRLRWYRLGLVLYSESFFFLLSP